MTPTDTAPYHIFDTTLRDGMQTPGLRADRTARLSIARTIAQLGVDVLEIGMPANPYDRSVMPDIAAAVLDNSGSAQVCGLARLVRSDIDALSGILKGVPEQRRRYHLFIGTSEQLRTHSIGKSQAQVLESIAREVGYARTLAPGATIQFSAEDATRTPYAFLQQSIRAAVRAGADVINVPDTTGWCAAPEYVRIINRLREDVPGASVRWSCHIHNDSGEAVAASASAVQSAGARQIEGTMLGIGERAGNADWMVVAMNLQQRGLRHERLWPAGFSAGARSVAALLAWDIPSTYPLVGSNAFATSSGIHAKGVLNDQRTYYVVSPTDVGQSASIVLGQTSGAHAVQERLRAYGISVPAERLPDITREVVFYAAERGPVDKIALMQICKDHGMIAEHPQAAVRNGGPGRPHVEMPCAIVPCPKEPRADV